MRCISPVFLVLATALGTLMLRDAVHGHAPRPNDWLVFIVMLTWTVALWRDYSSTKGTERIIWMTVMSLLAGALFAQTMQ